MNFHLIQNGQQLGPYSLDQIRQFLKDDLVTTVDQVWAEGWPAWVDIGNVPGLASFAASTEASVPVTGHQVRPPRYVELEEPIRTGQQYAEGKNPCVACGLSLGIVGIGQFYNGDWTKGWVMIITCIGATIFSFGTLWLFWALFSAVDAYRGAARKKPLGAMCIPF